VSHILARVIVVAAVAAAPLTGIGGCQQSRGPERIVLIVIDTLRRDHLSCYGSDTPTPNIDALAARGQLFTSAFSSFFQTSMSMGSLFTGRTPSLETRDSGGTLPWNGATWCGLARFAEKGASGACVPTSLSTLAEEVGAAGYWTIGVTSNTFLYRPAGFDAGFDDWVEIGSTAETSLGGSGGDANSVGHAVHGVSDAARKSWRTRQGKSVNAAVAKALERRPSDHFFLYVHFMDVHDYSLHKIPYEQAVRAADAAIGALLKELETRGLVNDAVFILTSDHGQRLGEEHVVPGLPGHMGGPSFDTLLKVPLIVAPPVFEETDRFVRSDDVHRLVKALATAPSGESQDLLPGELFVSEFLYVTYRDRRWKSYHNRGTGDVILIDLEADPKEMVNVRNAHPDIVEKHTARAGELTRTLSAQRAPAGELTEEDLERLRSLGYAE
jgi:arylsulfatase A-like enzyme